ncbi:hypothetical protein GOODEAATRI_000421 [Goodea atripinnis]|uniref:Uncharacterized protein n=1 Tax=Goodea atripinnis TaxID=208336 RepID=A0ABV0NGC8_9TELE
MHRCVRTAGRDGKATRSVTTLHQAAAGSISGVAPVKPLLSLRSDMSAAELRADGKAATPDSDLNDEPLLLPSEATDREGTPNKLYGKSTHISVLLGHKAAGSALAGVHFKWKQTCRRWDRWQESQAEN